MGDKCQMATERQLTKVIKLALKKLMNDIRQEPYLVIEGSDGIGGNEQQVNDIVIWLFKRR